MPLALLALAVGAFGIGTTEFVILGVLPDVAGTFGVSIPTAGWLASGYAIGVAAGAPVMTVLGSRVPRRRMLVALMALFVAGNLISALAPSFGLMLVGRLVASLTHGAFFGIGSVVAAELVPAARRATAIATMFTGLTVANVVGVPLGTWVGHALGWRATFAIVAGLGAVAMVAVRLLVPPLPRPHSTRIGAEVRALANVQVLLAMAMTIFGFGGVFAAITYIAPMMTSIAGFGDGTVSWLLVVLGVGMVVGNLLGGRYADRALMPLLYITLSGLGAVLALFTLTAHSKALAVPSIFLVGALGFASVPPLQKRVLDQASAAPTLASAVNIGAFNVGNALAAWLGGLVISAGLGYTAPNWVGALLAAIAVGLAVISSRLDRRPAAAAARELPEPVPALS
jgi:DHA1 family inner membrane transport protein